MNPTSQHPQRHGEQDASPFLALILGELLELRAVNKVHDMYLRDLLEKANGEKTDPAFSAFALTKARQQVYENVEEMMRETFPEHLEMVRQLFRETE